MRQKRSPGGTPCNPARKTETDRRGEQLHVRVRPDELAAIEQRAAACNMPLSDFIRGQALSGAVRIRQFNTLSAIDRHDLARIGSNLNQIARACNATGDTTRARNIEAYLEELRQFLSRLDTIGKAPDELGER